MPTLMSSPRTPARHHPAHQLDARPKAARVGPVLFLAPLLLVACSSPPKPPTVDESTRRPVNASAAVDLQACRNDLHNARLVAVESTRLAEASAASLSHLAARQQAMAALQPPRPTAPEANQTPAANTLLTVRFAFGSSQVAIPTDTAKELVEQARSAPLVLLRGRTDGSRDSPVESRLARDRAVAVRQFLVLAGVEPRRIRTTYQPVGDHVADNDSPSGRELNRRVEIELYRALPVALGTSTRTGPDAQP